MILDLDAARIEADLGRRGSSFGAPLSLARETASTNDDARRAAAAGAPHGAVFLADSQTAGRGRGGHTWHSPPGENLYLSIVLRPAVAASAVAPITLAIGLAIARVVAAQLPGRATLKWPNDVFLDGRKLAGVLVEGQLRGDRLASLVAGIGLNVGTRAFPPELAERATSLALAGAPDLDRSHLAAALIAEIGAVVALFEHAHLAPFLAEIRALDHLHGRAIEVADLRGTAAGIDPAGRLLLRDATGTLHRITSGEALLIGSAQS